MKKAVLIPDSFKGTLSSLRICELMRGCIEELFPGCETVSIPVADGGEGSVEAFLEAVGGRRVEVQVTGPWFEPCTAHYGLLRDGGTAVLEMAAAAGLPMVGERRDPSRTTTYGLGELLLHAVRSGARRIILGLGGSATNDGGCGAAAAAGVRFLDRDGRAFVPVGGTLRDIAGIDMSGLDPCLRGIELTAMCDIDNPLFGKSGAAYVFGPQKGADEAMVRELDEGLRHLADVILRDTGADVSLLPGSGAAGGMGAGMAAFFGAQLRSGIETVLDVTGFDGAAAGADVIFTGEGKLDSQSLRGKVVIGVARRAARLGVPVIAIVGGADYGAEAAWAEGVTAVFPTNRLPQDFSLLRPHSEENLVFTFKNVLRTMRAAGR